MSETVTKPAATKKRNGKMLTVDLLKGKRLRRRKVKINLNGEEFYWTFQAIPAYELDQLQEKHPPTKEQRARGMTFNVNTFAPELVSKCSVDPELSVEDAREIWNSEVWSTGELNFIFDTCTQLCTSGFDVPFTEPD